jgi:hypothetical protein
MPNVGGDIDLKVIFAIENSNINSKIRDFGRKKLFEDVVTLGPMAQLTSVIIIIIYKN